jgi:hypothetical protein
MYMAAKWLKERQTTDALITRAFTKVKPSSIPVVASKP